MINIKDLSISYGKKDILKNVVTSFENNELTALIGRNGSGKSTFLKTLASFLKSYSGTIEINGRNLNSLSAPELAKQLSFVTTKQPRIPNMKCKDIVALGRSPHTGWFGNLSDSDKRIIDESLDITGMSDFSNRNLDSMSDGECQRVMIARALAQDTPIILLDEPTSFLDIPNRYELGRLLRKLCREKNKTIIFSTHELDVATEVADKIALIGDLKIYNLPVDEMLRSDLIQQVFEQEINLKPRINSK